MKEQEQQIAIAKACEWVNIVSPSDIAYKLIPETARGKQVPFGRNVMLHPDGFHHELPDYRNDLNAMHEAEKVVRQDGVRTAFYRRHLTSIIVAYNTMHECMTYPEFATAEQRAEAFVRTLGDWDKTSEDLG